MRHFTFPAMTASLFGFMAALHWLLPNQEFLWFSAAAINQGEAWRLLTAHFAHADLEHLLWNGLGLVVLGSLIEQQSRRQLAASLAAGIFAVNALLLSPLPTPDYYCGLSGVLNTLLVTALWLEWKRSPSWLVAAIALGSLSKVLIEVTAGTSVITHISWPPYAWSHVAGMLGGVALICFGTLSRVEYSEYATPKRTPPWRHLCRNGKLHSSSRSCHSSW